MKDLKIKTLALTLALALKIYVDESSDIIPITIPIEVEVKNLPNNLMITRPLNLDKGVVVSLDLKGPRILTERVKSYPNSISVDYPDDEVATLAVDISRDRIWVPPGVEILNITPNKFEIDFDRVVVKEVDIVAKIEGKVSGSKKIKDVKLHPDRALIRGPKKEIERVTKIQTESIDVSNLTQDKEYSVFLLNRNKSIMLPKEQVNVIVELE